MKKLTYKVILPLPEDKVKDKASIVLGGDLTINTAKELSAQLANVIVDHENFHIKIAAVENLDLAFLQVIHSFVVSAKEKGKTVTISSSLSPEISLLVKNGGLSRILSPEVKM